MRPRPLITATSIQRRVRQLGAGITAAYAGRDPVLLVVMDGAMCFAGDLARAISLPGLKMAFLRVRSYRGTQAGPPLLGAIPDLVDEHVLVVDDILDTGRTLQAVVTAARAGGASSVGVVVALDKPARRLPDGLARADWVGFTIPDVFVVGYGLDLDGRWRHLPDVCTIAEPVALRPAGTAPPTGTMPVG
jgi:hypoxanthine phosphoribosyltransferase